MNNWATMGLGLTITEHIVELHGGSVTAEGAGEGTGSTFLVRLPLNRRLLPERSELAVP